MNPINFFESMDHIQPKCPGCGIVLDFGSNTKYSEEHSKHICDDCGHIIEENMDAEIKIVELAEDEP